MDLGTAASAVAHALLDNANPRGQRLVECHASGIVCNPPLPTLPAAEMSTHLLSQRRANPSSPCGMKITMAMKMMPTGIR